MFSRQSMQDSYTLDNYIYFMSRRQEEEKERQGEQSSHIMDKQFSSDQIQKTQYLATPKRKMSTQLSIFSWLVKDKPQQKSLLLQLDKQLILKIFSYLRISQTVIVSRVSSYLLSCYKHLWIDRNYFEMLQTDKLTSQQLHKVMQKSRLQHIKQLKLIYQGKNIKKNRQKYPISYKKNQNETNGWQCKQKYYVRNLFHFAKIKNGNGIHHGCSPIKHTQLILQRPQDNITSSLSIHKKNLRIVALYITPKISYILQLVFIFKEIRYVTTQSLIPIFKRCLNLKKIEISQCKNIDENIFKYLKSVESLQHLGLKNFRQSFGNIGLLSQCQILQSLNIDDSLINDDEFMACMREVKTIKYLSIQGCLLLTDVAIGFLVQKLQKKEFQLKQIVISRINTIDDAKIQQLQQKLYKRSLQNQPA